MPKNNSSINNSLFDLLKGKGYSPTMLSTAGKEIPTPDEAEVFQFNFVKDGEDYGKVTLTIDDSSNLIVYYSDDVADSEKETSTESGDLSWYGLLNQLKRFAQRYQLSFELRNTDNLKSDMAKRDYMKKQDQIAESRRIAEMDNRTLSGDRKEQRANSPEAIAQREKEQQAELKKVSPEMRKKLRLPNPDKEDMAEGSEKTASQMSFDNSSEDWKTGYKDYPNYKLHSSLEKTARGKKYRQGWEEAFRASKRIEALKKQDMAEGQTGVSVKKWAAQVRQEHGADTKFSNDKVHDRVIARKDKEIIGSYDRKANNGTVFSPDSIKEGTNDSTQVLSDIVANEDFDALYNLMSSDTEAGKIVQRMYNDVSGEEGLHPDDDFEKILSIVLDHLTQDYGQQNMAEANGGHAGSAKVRYTGGMHGEYDPTKKQASPQAHLDAAKYHNDEANKYIAAMNHPKSDQKNKEWYKNKIQHHKNKADFHIQASGQQDVAEGSADKTVRVVKRNGKPIGEIGIDPEASPGNGSYYVKLYDGSVDESGFDTAEEALAELKYLVKQNVSEDLHLDEGITDFILKAKDKFLRLKDALSDEWAQSKQMWQIVKKGNAATSREINFANNQFKDILKMVGLGAWYTLPIPGNTLLILMTEKLLNRNGMSIMPDKIKNQVLNVKEKGIAEGYSLKKTSVSKHMEPGDPEEYTQDVNIKDTDYEIINNKTGQVVGTASQTTNDFMGSGALKITMKNGATRWLDIWDSEKGNPQTAFNRFVKDPKTASKYKGQDMKGVTEMDKSQTPSGRDGHVSHSTYGSRDKGDSTGPERTAKPVTAKQATTNAMAILNKQSKKKDMAEAKGDEYYDLTAEHVPAKAIPLIKKELAQAGITLKWVKPRKYFEYETIFEIVTNEKGLKAAKNIIWKYNKGNYVGIMNEQNVAKGTQQLSVQQLATVSDEALDNAYHYGRSSPGNTFGWQANLKSAEFAKRMIDAGITDIEKISDAIHKGWNVTAKAFVENPEQFDDTEKLKAAGKLEAKLQQRAKLMNIGYSQLPDEEQEKDRVVARALLQALTGQQDMAEGNPQVNEGYYPMGKQGSYSDAVPTTKIVIQHSRRIEEGEQRYRNIAKIFVENTQGERFAVPTNKPGLARVYARHIAEGGTPYDERGRHITSLVEEYSKMSGFMRATRGKQFNESAQKLVTEAVNYYQSLRESLSKMTGHRGYNAYFESWTPALMEDGEEQETNLNELFVQETLDPRIESVMPILGKLQRKLGNIKQVDELAEWADNIIEGDGREALNPQGIPEAAGAETLAHNIRTDRSNLKAFDLEETTDVTDDNPKSQGGTRAELLRKYANTKRSTDAEAARRAGATQSELKAAADSTEEIHEGASIEDIQSDILYRVMRNHPDLVSKYGPEYVADKARYVASFHTDAEEIGGSDKTAMVNHLVDLLKREGENGLDENLDANQIRAGQLGPTEKVGPQGAVGKLVGAEESVNESEDELARILQMVKHKR